MATKIYDAETVTLLDGTEVRLVPLKIKYLREFMELFEFVKNATNDNQAMLFLTECARVAMKQYNPDKIDIEEYADIHIVYKIIEVAAGIKLKPDAEEAVKDQATEGGSTWDTLDLAKLESEAFLLGIWDDYEHLESSLSMPELTATLESKRELDYEEKKFLAAIQGVDIEKDSNKGKNAWEEMKARVFSGGGTSDPNDVVALQGVGAQKAGFGIGMGLSYEKIDKPSPTVV